ncbi:MAG: hypothetical protein AAF666_20140 [Pseudomonadota bacterium]
MPQAVLVGSDVVPIDNFAPDQSIENVVGTFTTETGGAEQTLQITQAGKERWQIVRSIIEPGEPAFEKTYFAMRALDLLRSESGGMAIRMVSDGVLMLETEDSEIVPADLWIFYRRD